MKPRAPAAAKINAEIAPAAFFMRSFYPRPAGKPTTRGERLFDGRVRETGAAWDFGPFYFFAGMTPAQIEKFDRDTEILVEKINFVFGAVVDDLKRTSAYIKHRLDINEGRLKKIEQELEKLKM